MSDRTHATQKQYDRDDVLTSESYFVRTYEGNNALTQEWFDAEGNPGSTITWVWDDFNKLQQYTLQQKDGSVTTVNYEYERIG